MSSITTATFWKDTAERVVSTAAQAAIGVIVVQATIQDVDWANLGGVVGIAAAVSLLKALVASNVGDQGTASLVDTEPEEKPADL